MELDVKLCVDSVYTIEFDGSMASTMYIMELNVK